MDVKQPISYKEQIELLKDRGCVIEDETVCENALTNLNYYRLTAYFLPFKQEDGKYSEGTNFNQIYQLYEFDRKLRALLFGVIETIEVSLRSRFSYYHAVKYGPLGYLNPDNFNNKHNADKFKANLDREIENNSKVLFVKHHLDNYDGNFPLWVISELFTFGMTSYFYNDLKTPDKKALVGKDYKDMVSWLRCCTDLRNICAHYGRLYYRIFTAMPNGFGLTESQKRRLWGAILSVKALYPSVEKWNNEFMPEIIKLFDSYDEYIDLYHIAFPDDWKEKLYK